MDNGNLARVLAILYACIQRKNLEVVTYFRGLSEFRKVWTSFDQFHKKCWQSSKKETRAEQGEGRPVTPGPGS